MSTTKIYETENLSLFYKPLLLTVLTTDHGIFVDEYENYIGKVITIEIITDAQGNKVYKCKYPKVIQHFPEGYSWTWVYKDGGYVREP